MKAFTHQAIGLCIISFLVFCLAAPWQVRAQQNGAESSTIYSRAELAQLLAPIALYPDVLLSQILMASTYPIEVIEADHWLASNPGIRGVTLDNALLAQDWDPSVKALCYVPSILSLMSRRISETTDLGNAFLAQEDDVMNMIQELRAKAYSLGNLSPTSGQNVIVQDNTISIVPADPTLIYVPYYDSSRIFGAWWYPNYPPYIWSPPGVSLGFGIYFWPPFSFNFAFGIWSSIDWPGHFIYLHANRRPRYLRRNRWISRSAPWRHTPTHRRGAAYRDNFTARKYGQSPRRRRAFDRDTRGFPEPRVQKRIENRPGMDRLRIERERHSNERVIIMPTTPRQREERTRQMRQQTEQQERQQPDRTRQTPQQAKRTRPQSGRDNVFNRVDEGRKARESSQRGRRSRGQEQRDSRERGRSRP